jgi:hypothetical protein
VSRSRKRPAIRPPQVILRDSQPVYICTGHKCTDLHVEVDRSLHVTRANIPSVVGCHVEDLFECTPGISALHAILTGDAVRARLAEGIRSLLGAESYIVTARPFSSGFALAVEAAPCQG